MVMLCRFIVIFQDIVIWQSALLFYLVSISIWTLILRINQRRSLSSGDVGIFLCRVGYATIFIFLWEVTVTGSSVNTSIWLLPCSLVDYGMGLHGILCFGVLFTEWHLLFIKHGCPLLGVKRGRPVTVFAGYWVLSLLSTLSAFVGFSSVMLTFTIRWTCWIRFLLLSVHSFSHNW